MNPEKPSPPPQTDSNNPVIGSEQKPSFPREDEMFIIQPTPKKPLDKKSLAIVITLSVIGIAILIGVLIFALISSAAGLANDHRRLSLVQVKKIDSSLILLAPSQVLNKRNIDTPTKMIELSRQSQPSLENVLFIGGISERYTQTEQLQKKVGQHYDHIDSYVGDLKKLIAFDDNVKIILLQEPNLAAILRPNDSLSIRTVSGTYEGFAKNIESQPASAQMTGLKKQLVASFKAKSTTYLNWAIALEGGDMSAGTKATQELAVETSKISPLVQDKNYVKLFTQDYQALIKEQKALKSQLASR